jgi:hypothetical protein
MATGHQPLRYIQRHYRFLSLMRTHPVGDFADPPSRHADHGPSSKCTRHAMVKRLAQRRDEREEYVSSVVVHGRPIY